MWGLGSGFGVQGSSACGFGFEAYAWERHLLENLGNGKSLSGTQVHQNFRNPWSAVYSVLEQMRQARFS